MTDDESARAIAAGVHTSTRRELVRGGVAATAAVALAATAPALLDPPNASAASNASAAPAGDAASITFLLRVEEAVVFAYERSLATGMLSAAAQPVVALFLDHERAHVHALSVSLSGLGGAVPAPPADMVAFESELRRLRIRRSPATLRGERELLRFLIDLERVIARHYRAAIEHLSDDHRLVLAAEIMANEAQHATVLRELLSPGNVKRAVPSGFVAGVM